ncbi:MAG: hypothetical protein WC495_04255 [Patescibacteria group bacterium]|jgi:hypothetical protein
MDKKFEQTTKEWAMIILFLAFLGAPLFLFALHPFKNSISVEEKRAIAKAPTFTLSTFMLDTYQDEYEKYFDDHFGLRDQMITANSLFHYYLLSTSPNAKVLIGDNHWLFYSAEKTIDRFRSGNVLTSDELSGIAQFLQDEQQKFDQQGIEFVVLVAPDKETIYPENLPVRIEKALGPSTLDSFLEAMSKTTVTVIDPRGELRAHVQEEKLYAQTDTHWTDPGAAIAFEQLQESLGVDSVDTPKYRETESREGDLADLMSLGGKLRESVPVAQTAFDSYTTRISTRNGIDFRETENVDAEDNRHVLVFRDSFGEKLMPFFSETFVHVTFERAYFDQQLIDETHPDVVVLQIVERNIPRLTQGRNAIP